MDVSGVVITLPAALALVVTVLGSAVGAVAWLSSQLQAIRDGQAEQLADVRDRINELRLTLAQDYVRRAELEELSHRVSAIELARARGRTPTGTRGVDDWSSRRPHRDDERE